MKKVSYALKLEDLDYLKDVKKIKNAIKII